MGRIKKLAVWLAGLGLLLALVTGCAGAGGAGKGQSTPVADANVQQARESGAYGAGAPENEAGSLERKEAGNLEGEEAGGLEGKEAGNLEGEEAGGPEGKEAGGPEGKAASNPEKEQAGGLREGREASGGGGSSQEVTKGSSTTEIPAEEIDEAGVYNTKDEVALYLHIYGHLPDNYITKKEAESLGWNSKKGNLWEVAPGMSIGGSRFGNYEGQLPEKKGRKYYECDLEYDGGYRGAKRLVYSDDGLVFYTEDHYKTFEQLY